LFIDTLIEKEGCQPEIIFLFGFSTGACLDMELGLDRFVRGKRALGGAVCIAGGCIEQNKNDSANSKASEQTPVLIVGGSKDETFPPTAVKNAVETYNEVNSNTIPASVYIKEGKGHAMVQSPEEMEAVMKFFSRITW
jgi:predicted esterase